MTRRKNLPDGYIYGPRGAIYHIQDPPRNHDGSLNVYGPVIWDGTRGRYVAHGRSGYRTLSVTETPRQLTLDGAA